MRATNCTVRKLGNRRQINNASSFKLMASNAYNRATTTLKDLIPPEKMYTDIKWCVSEHVETKIKVLSTVVPISYPPTKTINVV